MGSKHPTGQDGTALLRLASADNFRDAAGPGEGYRTRTGRMPRGMFFRSNDLSSLTAGDIEVLTGAELACIRDLRQPEEVQAEPDHEVPGAVWQQYALAGVPMDEVSGADTFDSMQARMMKVYQDFVTVDANARSLGRLLDDLAHGTGVELIRCACGKDRTGWVVALLHHIAGVDPEVTAADFLLSNEFSAASREQMRVYVTERYGAHRLPTMEPVMTATRESLQAGFDQVASSYGDLDTYLVEGLGLDELALDALRVRLTT